MQVIVTKEDWINCKDPYALFWYLTVQTSGTGHDGVAYGVERNPFLATDRQLRLIACAASRLKQKEERNVLSPLLQKVINLAECYADGLERDATLKESSLISQEAGMRNLNGLYFLFNPHISTAVGCTLQGCSNEDAVQQSLCHTIHDVVRNPFLPSLKFPTETRVVEARGESSSDRFETEETYCPWLTSLVVTAARCAYEDRQQDGFLKPDHLLPLSDLLDDACGDKTICSNCKGRGYCDVKNYHGSLEEWACEKCGGAGWFSASLLLEHLRDPEAKHVRGCWAVDFLSNNHRVNSLLLG